MAAAKKNAGKKRKKRYRSPNRTIDQQIADVEAKIAELSNTIEERAERREAQRLAEEEKAASALPFKAKWIADHRAKVQLSAADYALLIGVTPLTIYNWEKGRSKPRAKQLEAWHSIKKMGKAKAWRTLEDMGY